MRWRSLPAKLYPLSAAHSTPPISHSRCCCVTLQPCCVCTYCICPIRMLWLPKRGAWQSSLCLARGARYGCGCWLAVEHTSAVAGHGVICTSLRCSSYKRSLRQTVVQHRYYGSNACVQLQLCTAESASRFCTTCLQDLLCY